MRGDRSESGFTLVELLVATVVSGIIIGGIASIMIVTLQAYPRSATKLAVSDNVQLLSSWLVPDIQSAAGTASGIQAPRTPNSGCTTPSGAPATDELRLTWSSDAVIPDSAYSADYCLVGSELIRYYVQAGQPPTQTVVSRDVAAGGVVVLTGQSTSGGDAPPVPTVDSVDVAVTTTDVVNGTPYRFHVTASRRTPALRIFPVPDINILRAANPGLVNGTAVPGAPVTVVITDQANPQSNPPEPQHKIGPVVVDAAGDGTWTESNIPWSSCRSGDGDRDAGCLNDGLITFDVQTTDGNGHISTATTTAYKDTTAPIVTVTELSPAISQGPDLPLRFLVTASEPITDPTSALQASVQTLNPNAGVPNDPNLTIKVDPGTPCSPGSTSECFKVFVSGLNTTDDSGDGQVVVTLPAGAVTDLSLNQSGAASTATVNWDLNAPHIVSVSPVAPTTTNTQPLDFLVTFSKAVVGQLVHADIVIKPAADNPGLYQGRAITQVACGPVTECFLIQVGLDPNSPAGPVTVTVNAGVFHDYEGLPNTDTLTSPPITWSPLTIAMSGPTNGATFSGQGNPGTVTAPGVVTVSICSDARCATPTRTLPPISVDPASGAWTTTSVNPTGVDTTGSRYAQVTQIVNGVTLTATFGPFGP